MDIDHPDVSPEPQVLSPTPLVSPLYNGLTHSPQLGSHKISEPQTWSSPAFLKRKHYALEPFLNSAYDPFLDEDGCIEELERKRTKFGRGSGQWRFSDRTPSPEKDLGVPTPDTTDRSTSNERAHALEPREGFAVASNVGSTGSHDALVVTNTEDHLPSSTINTDEPPSPSVAAESQQEEILSSSQEFEGQETMAEINRNVSPNSAFTEDVSVEEYHVISQTELIALETVEALEYKKIDMTAGASTPHASSSLHINTTTATPDFSASDQIERFETPDPPRLRPLLSPGLPLVSPLVDRKGKVSIPFDADADADADLLAETGNPFAVVGSSAGSPKPNEIPPTPSEKNGGRNTTAIKAPIKVDLEASVQPEAGKVNSQIQVPVYPAFSTNLGNGMSTIKQILPQTGVEQIVEPIVGSPQMGGPSQIFDRDYDSRKEGGYDEIGVSHQQYLTNNVPDMDEHLVRLEAAAEQLEYTNVPDMEPEPGTENDSLFDGSTSAGQDVEMPDEPPGVRMPSVDTPLDDLFDGSSIDFASSSYDSSDEGQGDSNKSVTRYDDREIDSVLDSGSEDTEEESEEDSDGEEELELEGINSDSAISSEDAELEGLDIVYSPRVLEIIALDTDEESVGDISEKDKLGDPMVDSALPPDMITQRVEESYPPAEAETTSPVNVTPIIQVSEVVSENSSVPEEVDLIPILEEHSAGSERRVHVPYEQAPSVLQSSTQDVEDDRTGYLSPIVGSEAGQTSLLEDTQGLQHSILDPRLRNQLATPDATQQAQDFSLASQESLYSVQQDRTLPTPQQSQNLLKDLGTASEPIIPERLSLIEKVKESRTPSAGSTRSVDDLAPKIISPYFTTSLPESSANSADESDADSVDHEDQPGKNRVETSSLEPIEQTAEEEQYSARMEGTSTSIITPPTGFRTPLAYFASLSSLSQHYNNIISILAISISSSTPLRSKSGPRDFHQAIYLADPSSYTLDSTCNFTTAQIFRPYKDALPIIHTGSSILLRNFKVQTQKGKFSLLSTDSSAWVVFSPGEEPQIRGPPVELGPEERGFAKGLGERWESLEEKFKGPLLARAEEARTETEAKMRRPAKGKKTKGKAAPRKSFVDGMHELRDGTRWTDESEESKSGLHELRDGTVWRDTEE